MTEQSNDNQARNTGAGSRQQEQQTAGGSFATERRDPGAQDPNQSGGSQMEQGGTYRPQGDRGVQFEADGGQDIDFETDQQGGALQQQAAHENMDENAARTDQPGDDPQERAQPGSRMGGDTRGGNVTNR